MKIEHVEGAKKAKVMLYALSTCVWCNKTKKLLGELGVDYYYANVDQLSEEDRDKVEKEIAKWNPSVSFPTLVIDDSSCIVGFNPEDIKKRLK
jgi:glutaredoxin